MKTVDNSHLTPNYPWVYSVVAMKLPRLTCKRCGHSWIPRAEKLPDVCAGKNCKSPYWSKDRKVTKNTRPNPDK